HVVGRVALPVLNTDVDRVAEGVLMTRPGLDAVIGSDSDPELSLVVRFAPGTKQDAGLQTLTRRFGPNIFATPSEPRELTNMRSVRGMPNVIGGLLAGMAVVTIGHLLVVGVRRRGTELGVLRAIGFRPRQIRAALRWQASTMAGVALALGVPAGLIVGNVAWTAIATQLGVVDITVLRGLAVAAVAIGLILVSLVLAIPPGRRAGNLSPAAALRVD